MGWPTNSPVKTPDQAPDRLHIKILGFIALAACGPVLLLASSIEEDRRGVSQPWRNALLAISEEPPWPDMQEAYVRSLGEAHRFPLDIPFDAYGSDAGEIGEKAELRRGPYVVCIELGANEWESLLERGRVPVTGAREAVAGAMCHLKEFLLDGQVFQVVGKLKRSVGALTFCYVVPCDGSTERYFTSSTGARNAWLDRCGRKRATEYSRPEDPALDDAEIIWIGGETPLDHDLAACNVLAMVLTAFGASMAWIYGLTHARRLGGARTAWVLGDFAEQKSLFAALHLVMYGFFFGSMLVGERLPFLRLHLTELVSDTFDSGTLSFVGDAYRSGDIVWAALSTWLWNFGAATLLLTIAPSLVIPFIGVLKTAFSFALVGFLMGPTRSGHAAHMAYHSVTMALELEGYIVASFAAALYPVLAFKAVLPRAEGAYLLRSFRLIGAAILVSGVILAVAALYEAATVILFAAPGNGNI